MLTDPIPRRQFLKIMGASGLGVSSAGFLAGCDIGGDDNKAAGTTAASDEDLFNQNDEYVYLSIVTQVPFWVDHKQALDDFTDVTGAKTAFMGPPDFDVAAQARQLDELISRKPAGIILFIGDADAMTPGINRAVDAGIPVVLVISDAPKSKRHCHIGINGIEAGKVGGQMLADAIGGKGKVILGTFPSPNVLDRVKGYRQYFKENHPDIDVVQVVNDRADPSYAPDAYAAAIRANPDVVGIGGTDGDSGFGAARAVKEAGKEDDIKIVAMDRNDDMLGEIESGLIVGSVVQKSYDEVWLACWMLYWLNHNQLKPVPDFRAANINPLPESIVTGVWQATKDNVAQFKHTKAA
jgi:ribose transport system substrate-binding protein